MTLFTLTPATRRGGTAARREEHDLQGFAVVAPDGSEVDWDSDLARVQKMADRLNALYPTEADIVPCRVCGAVVTSGDPTRYPYCRTCHYVGNASEDVRADSLYAFRVAFPDADVHIDHTGGGCFWMSIRWDGSDVYYALTDGEASLPTDSEGNPVRDGWGYVGRYCDDESSDDYEGFTVREADGDAPQDHTLGMTDAEVIAIVRADIAARAADESL